MQSLDHRMQSLDDKVQSLDHRVQSLDDKVQSLDDKVQSLDNRMQSQEGGIKSIAVRMDAVESQMKGLCITLENETNRNIRLIAEGHLNLSRKLDEALKVESEKELLLVRVNCLEDDVRILKERVL